MDRFRDRNLPDVPRVSKTCPLSDTERCTRKYGQMTQGRYEPAKLAVFTLEREAFMTNVDLTNPPMGRSEEPIVPRVHGAGMIYYHEGNY